MKKKNLVEKLNEFYAKLECILDDENIKTVGKTLNRYLDDFGSFIQELEDEEESEEKDEVTSDD